MISHPFLLRVLIIGVILILPGPVKPQTPIQPVSLTIGAKNIDRNPVKQLRILTLNSWFPPVKLPGNEQSRRIQPYLDSVLGSGADFICLQEMFPKKIVNRLMVEAGDLYHFSKIDWAGSLLSKVNACGGLLVLSKYPIVRSTFHQFPVLHGFRLDERIGKKGFTIVSIKVEDQEIVVVNVHLYSGRDYKSEAIRIHQIDYLFTILNKETQSNPFIPVILAGDFNMTNPSLRSGELGIVDAETYREITESQEFTDPSKGMAEFFTYDSSKNRYAALWYNRSERRQILDYIFYRDFSAKVGGAVKRVFMENPISDHYGVIHEVCLDPID